MTTQLTMQEIRDLSPMFDRYMSTPPKIYRAQKRLDGPVWWVYMQLEPGKAWYRVGVRSWRDGIERVALHNPHDWAITSKRRGYPVPTTTKINPKTKIPFKDPETKEDRQFRMKMPPDHTWCQWCRRPVVMRWFRKHHAFRGAQAYDPTRKRCTICGAAEQRRA